MFTGIVEELGEVAALEHRGDSARITINAPVVTSDATPGASIAVNGVCLTIVDHFGATFMADVMKETLDRTSLGALAPGARVNVERPVQLAGRLGGHLVQGHVDGVGRIVSRSPGSHWEVVRIAVPPPLSRYIVEKGSITVDGVSLTVSGLGDGWFEVSLIPTTLAQTTLGQVGPGEQVNLEVDIVAKYVERLLSDAGRGEMSR